MTMNGLYYGTIEEVFAPDHKMNVSKLQYEYRVLITGDDYSQIPVKCVRMDPYGSYHNYEDAVLAKGYRVFVQFPRGDRSMGLIIGGSRFNAKRTDPKTGIIYEHRFNEIVETHDFKGAWTLKSVDGPFIKLEKTKVTVSDTPIKQSGYQNENFQAQNNAAQTSDASNFDGQFVILDKTKGEIHINTNELKVVVNKNADVLIRKDSKVLIEGAASVTINKDATVAVKGNVNMSVDKDVVADIKGELKAKVGKNATVDTTGTAKVKAKEIQLQSSGAGYPMSELLTTKSMQIIDLITGVPSDGLKTIKGGT